MPWKGEKDPYKIWLSEIILQQTRVEQGLGYYNRFVDAFPDVRKLANAQDEKVFKYWEGLGYYSRCRNLLVAARYISKDLNGTFPVTYEEIVKLKGVGPYTAAAIASFAYNLPYAVVDGNVFRLLARVYGIDTPVDTAGGKKRFAALASELLDKKHPALYNQAIMDFGATICKPVSPLCESCILKTGCIANKTRQVHLFPVKLKKSVVKKRWFYYLVLTWGNRLAIQKRTSKDIWQGLYEFPLIETDEERSPQKVLIQAKKRGWVKQETKIPVLQIKKFTQQLSHQFITGVFIEIASTHQHSDWSWTTASERRKMAFPVLINRYFASKKTETKGFVTKMA